MSSASAEFHATAPIVSCTPGGSSNDAAATTTQATSSQDVGEPLDLPALGSASVPQPPPKRRDGADHRREPGDLSAGVDERDRLRSRAAEPERVRDNDRLAADRPLASTPPPPLRSWSRRPLDG